jgi:hypothetical protein
MYESASRYYNKIPEVIALEGEIVYLTHGSGVSGPRSGDPIALGFW